MDKINPIEYSREYQATIDLASGPVGQTRQLDTSPQTAIAWHWGLIRRPSASSAKLSATNMRNPTFTPDVPDLYIFRLFATNATGGLCMRTVSLTATVGPPKLSITPDGGGGYFLPRLVGLGKALELSMLADEVSGAEAERIGLVNKCVPQEEFETATMALAQRLAKGPTRAYGLIKELMNKAVQSDLETTLRIEGELQDIAIETADHREGVSAFLQKRPSEFTGR